MVCEVAELFGVHKNTVRNWVAEGLPDNDHLRPMLILGRELRKFLQKRNQKNKRPCKKNEMYCLKCRTPKIPAGNIVDYKPMNGDKGCLIGMCPTCENIMNRFSNLTKLSAIENILDVTIRTE